MTTTWTYRRFNVYKTYGDLTDVVYSYSYTVTVTDGAISASRNGSIRLNFDVITNFTPFTSLTKEIVQQWTEASIDTASIIKNLTEVIIANNAEVVQNLPAPWETPETPASQFAMSPERPGIKFMVGGLLKTAADVAVNAAKGGRTLASEELAEARLKLCRQCEFLTEKNRCVKCGCFMSTKTKIQAAKCPINKW